MRTPPNKTDEQKRDVALYFKEEGDENFSPAKNKFVIEQSIKKTNQLYKAKANQKDNEIGERVNAVVTYLRSRAAQGNTPVEKYFGKRTLAYLRGQKITEIVKTKIQGRVRKVYAPTE